MEPIIIKLTDVAEQHHRLNKIVANVPLSSFVDLISAANLEANPRLAKVGRVTGEIEESLEYDNEAFQFMSKGVLVAASEVEELERSRYRLSFADSELEGIIDGGHNTLAIGRHILRHVLAQEMEDEEVAETVDKIKTWEEFTTAWRDTRDKVLANKGVLPDTLIPIEIIYPSDDPDGNEYFLDKVLLINAARNNNAELTAETKANKRGYYSELRDHIDAALLDQVEWKTNDGGRIKVRDLVALALIPLSKLPFKSLEPVRKNPSVIFSSKGQCVAIYDALMQEKGIVEDVKGGIVEIVDPDVKSAIKLASAFPRLFDKLYEKMPLSYNAAGGKFAKIDSVKGSGSGKSKYSTKFYKNAVAYRYGEGFMYPLVFALSALIKHENGELKWIADPDKFIDEHLDGVMRSFYSMITGLQWDPAKVGKANGAYNLSQDLFLAGYKDDLLKAHNLS